MSYLSVGAVNFGGGLFGGVGSRKTPAKVFGKPVWGLKGRGIVAQPVSKPIPVVSPLAKKILAAFQPTSPVTMMTGPIRMGAKAVSRASVLATNTLAPSTVVSSLSTPGGGGGGGGGSWSSEASPDDEASWGIEDGADESDGAVVDGSGLKLLKSGSKGKIPWVPLAIAGAAAWFLLK